MLPAADAVLPEQLPVCPEHPERPSLATCERCGRFLCEDCAVTREPPRCAACHARVGDPLGILSQPFSVDRAFSHGWKLFRTALPSLLPVALVYGIPGGLLSHFFDSDSDRGALLLERLYELTAGTMATGACLALLVGVAEGQRVSVPRALRQGITAWPSILGATIRQGLYVLLYGLLLIVPGIVKGVTFSLCTQAAFREPGRDALKNSEQLVTGRRWEVFGMLVGAYTLVFALLFPGVIVFGVISRLAPSTEPVMAIFFEASSRIAEAFVCAVGLAAFYGFKSLHGEPLEPR
jgi:hypothetical protein